MKMSNGGYEDRQPGKTLYKLKFPVVFSAAINSGTLGIAIGALETYRSYMEQRVSGRRPRREERPDPAQRLRARPRPTSPHRGQCCSTT